MSKVPDSCSPSLNIRDISRQESRPPREGQAFVIVCCAATTHAESRPIRQPSGVLKALASAQVQSGCPVIASATQGLRFGQRVNQAPIVQPDNIVNSSQVGSAKQGNGGTSR